MSSPSSRNTSEHRTHPDIVVIGAGVIGLGIAWRLASSGARVRVHDKGRAGGGASHAAAGMLAACAEAEPGEEALVALGRVRVRRCGRRSPPNFWI